MIPLKLNLRNFMCYRGSENTVDFSGIHLACLVGDNGQGKSALLDAMTWALWGKARTNSADALITYGESEMQVSLEFELAKIRYRVIRQRNSSGRGGSLLELQGRTKSGFFAPLSEGTIRQTQRRITDLLKLDYETFVNSAFLLQGRADEFTVKRPSERKQILADILRLAQYDEYAEQAKKKAKEADNRRQRAEQQLKEIKAIAARIPALQEKVVNTEAEARRLTAQMREANTQLHQLQDQRRELDAKAEAMTQAERRAKECRREIARIDTRLGEYRRKIEYFDALLARSEEIKNAITQLEQARQAKERWDDALRQSLQLQQEASGIQNQINLARSQLAGELKSIEREIRTYQKTLKRFESQQRVLAEAQKRVELLQVLQSEREEQQRLLVQWSGALGQLQAENQTLKDKMHDLKERMDILANTDETICPVCRQPLSADAHTQALNDAQEEGTTMGDQYRTNRREMQKAKQEVESLRHQIASADRQLRELGQWQQRAAKAAQAAQEMLHAQQQMSNAEQQAGTLRARLEAGDYAQAEQTRLAELASANASLGYNAEEHNQAKQTIQRLAPREEEFKELTTADERRNHLLDLLRSSQENVRHWQKHEAAAKQEIQTLAQELQQRSAVFRRVQEQQVLVNNLQKSLTKAQRHHGAAQQRLEDAEKHAAKQPSVEEAHHAAVADRTIYEQLVNAFGKRGIQAMIIESAIPEIEDSANELLGRMTNGRMNVALLTQRELKSGNISETLDIVIADEHGERPYETFSGGEAFRVNFALRIALSKLLAQRAGTNLRTLVIDEGFGSQDAHGRQRLIEAITSVQNDFERILVITHIDELKDAFPVRIDVVKGVQGSMVTVN